MSITLRDYQMEAVGKMRNGCILCGGVGSGKSLTALAYYYLQYGGNPDSLAGGEYQPMDDVNIPDLYIITTARKRDTFEWEGELVPFLLYSDMDGNRLYKNQVIIDSWNNIKKYKDVKDAFFIFDEQRVVGRGVWVKSFLRIAKHNKWVLLSATPGDTWQDYIPVFIANGFFKNRTEFSREHMVINTRGGFPKVERYLGTKKLERLRSQILVTMGFQRETISHHEDVYVAYDPDMYKQVTKSRWNPFTDEPIVNAAELCYIWRKIVNSSESRQVALLEVLEEHPKVIVFYNFDYELDILRGLAYGPNTRIAEWNGHKHEPIPKGDAWVYLVQYTAGAEGWNCVQTDTTIFFSQSYSYKTMVQAAGRIDRLNTPFTDLYYFHLKSRSPIDIGIARALTQKRNFNERGFVKW